MPTVTSDELTMDFAGHRPAGASTIRMRLAAPPWWPHLSPVQAQQFQAERLEGEDARLLRNVLIGAVLYATFAFSDLTTLTDIVPFALVFRLAVMTPLILLIYPMRRVAYRRGHPVMAETLTAVIALGLQASLAVLLVKTRSPHAAGYFGGFFPIMVYSALMLRIRLPLALVAMVGLGAVSVVGLQAATVVRPEIADETTTVVAATVVLLLVVLVSREIDLRRAFLLRGRLQEANARLAVLTELDELTGLPNRRALQARLEDWDRGGRHGAVVMVDIDRFKTFNDLHGHATGDACLRLVAQAMATRMRHDGGFVGRYGGEEFTLLLPGLDEASAAVVTERLRAAVEQCDLGGLRVTISLGWACSGPGDIVPSAHLVQRADEAVLAAKAAGRNQVVRWQPSGTPSGSPRAGAAVSA